MKNVILASTSPRRKELLEKTGLIFEVVSSNYEEDMTLNMPPAELVKFLSKGKAESVAKNFPDAIIISADTLISIDGKIFGKPHTVENSKKTLKILSGREHSVFTGFTILDTQNNKVISKAVETNIFFKELSDKMIEDYIKNDNPLEYAGSYALQDVFDIFVEKIEGGKDNAIGLPVEAVLETLKEFDIFV